MGCPAGGRSPDVHSCPAKTCISIVTECLRCAFNILSDLFTLSLQFLPVAHVVTRATSTTTRAAIFNVCGVGFSQRGQHRAAEGE